MYIKLKPGLPICSYQKLGLLGNLSLRDSGGKEKDFNLQASSSIPESVKVASKKKPGMAKVQRDAEGKIVLVEEPESKKEDTAWGPALNSDEEEKEESVMSEDEEEGDSGEEERIEPNREVTDSKHTIEMTILRRHLSD